MFDFDVAVIIPMAGSGERFPLPEPKQYLNVMGKPLFMYCVEQFCKFPFVKKICLMVDRVDFVREIIQETFKEREKIMVVKGGSTRHYSIKNGLIELSKSEYFYKIVVIHDGVRPVVPEQLLITVISEAVIHGAAGATRPLISTIVKPMVDGCLESTLDRNSYLKSETPQAFQFQLIMNAYQQCSENEMKKGTECLQLALKYQKVSAKLVPGPDTLWKVTEKKDFYSIVAFLKGLSINMCILGGKNVEIIECLKKSLMGRVKHVECFASVTEINCQENYNTVVCWHDEEINWENHLQTFATVLDISHHGLIIHVIEEPNVVDKWYPSRTCVFHSIEKIRNRHFEETGKGVIIIYYSSQGEEKKLVDLIVSLVFIDPQTIGGQILFL